MDLVQRSVSIILENQTERGAYPASPRYPTYRYSWMRDGSFIAYAMLRAGRRESARRFLLWAADTIQRHEYMVADVEEKLRRGTLMAANAFLPARFTLSGENPGDEWPAFQSDGYGAWLWCVGEYVKATGDHSLVTATGAARRTVVHYLDLVRALPTYDCWEETGHRVHPSTLACIYGGLKAEAELTGVNGPGGPDPALLAGLVRASVVMHSSDHGFLPKSFGNPVVDSSLLWASVPFGLLAPEEPLMVRTVEEIERTLLVDGGVHRYRDDTFYGGGRWILLTAWLGWYYARVGRNEEAARLAAWIEEQADAEGYLPEQTTDVVLDRSRVAEWVERWGSVAKPLLWSHAMYIVLKTEPAG